MEMYYQRSIRLLGYDYSRPGAYFVTMCTENRECHFGNIVKGKMILNDWGNVVNEYRLITENHFQNIKFDSFVTTPNHFHVIIKIIGTGILVDAGSPRTNANNTRSNTTNSIVGNSDTNVDHQNVTNGNPDVYNANMRGDPAPTLGQIVGFFKYGVSKRINQIRETPGVKLWQRNYYEHIIRDNNEYDRIVKYIKNNPIKWELDFLNSGNAVRTHCRRGVTPLAEDNSN
jgi:REP element-mobilizing transposase RayT